ncbi:MAG: glycosyltransferase [Chlamydiota bacterium]|nr:glycosyltransferase [Chlamydiota bacterium]
MDSTISLIIPTYNRAYCLTEALESIYAQTLRPHEIIVVDDGSEDETPLVCSRYPALIYIRQSHKGVSSARNLGIQKSTGSWICFLDSDDIWEKNKLMIQWKYTSAQPNYFISYTNEKWIRNSRFVNQGKRHKKYSGWIFKHCLALCIISPSSVMIHRKIFDHIGLFDIDLPACEDYDLWLRISLYYPVLFIDLPLIIKRGGHEDQLSRQIEGLDRYRIIALEKILRHDTLDPDKRNYVLKYLHEKVLIYIKGCEKRNKAEEVKSMNALLLRNGIYNNVNG